MDAQTTYETARVALIKKLTTEQNTIKTEAEATRRLVRDLNTERVKATQMLRFKEVDRISGDISKLRADVSVLEQKVKDYDRLLEDARQGRAPELQAAHMRAMQQPVTEAQAAIHEAERQVRKLLDVPEIKEAVANLHALVHNKGYAYRVVLESVGLDDLPRRVAA